MRRDNAHSLAAGVENVCMYDLVLRGGTVVDPSQGLNSPMDVAVDNGRIVEVAPTHRDRGRTYRSTSGARS